MVRIRHTPRLRPVRPPAPKGMGMITHYTPDGRGAGTGRIRFMQKREDGSKYLVSIEFHHSQLFGQHDLPLALGLYPVRGQAVAFEINRNRHGRHYAASITSLEGGGVCAAGTPMQPGREPLEDLQLSDEDLHLSDAEPEPQLQPQDQPQPQPQEQPQPQPVARPSLPQPWPLPVVRTTPRLRPAPVQPKSAGAQQAPSQGACP